MTKAGRRWDRWTGRAPLLLALVALAAAVLSWSVHLARVERDRQFQHWREHLEDVAEDRLSVFEMWRRERLADARVVAAYPTTVSLLRGEMPADEPGIGDRAHLGHILSIVARGYGYEGGWLLDERGQTRGASDESLLLTDSCGAVVGDVVSSKRAVVRPCTDSKGSEIVLTAAPVLDLDERTVLGVVAFASDADNALVPLTRDAPIESDTIRIFVARRDREMTWSVPRIDLQSTESFEELRTGEPGLLTGSAGENRIALVRTVAGSSWFVVVTIDEAEILASYRSWFWRVILDTGLAILVVGLALIGIFRERERRRLKRLQRAESRYALFLENANESILFVDRHGRIREASRAAEDLYGYSRETLRGMSIYELRPPGEAEKVDEDLDRILEGPATFETVNIRRDGSSFNVEVSSRVVEMDGEPIFLSISRDVTSRKEFERQLLLRSRQHAAVADLGKFVLSTPDLDDALRYATKTIIETMNLPACAVLELEPDAEKLLMRAGSGWPESLIGELRIPAGATSQAGYTLSKGQPVVTADFRTETRFAPPPIARERGFTGGISVAIEGSGRAWGVLIAHATESREFSESDVDFFTSVANILAEAIVRRHGEIDLRDREQRLRSLFDNALVGIAIVSLDGRVLETNDAFARMLGREPREILGTHFATLTHPDDVHRDVELFEEMLDGERASYAMEKRYLRRNGGSVWGRLFVSLIRDPEGNPAYVTGVVEDIDEAKRGEEALRKSEERFRLIADNAKDVVFRYDFLPEPSFTYLSPVIETITGYAPDEFYRDPSLPFRMAHPEDREWIMAQVEEGKISNVPVELRWYGRNGRAIWGELAATALRDDEGRLVAIEGIARDITERKRVEDERERLLERLRHATIRLAEVEQGERKTLARELHDQVGPQLTALSINLSLIESGIGAAAGGVRERIDDSMRIIEETGERIRGILNRLRPPMLDDFGLTPTLEWLAETVSKRSGLSVEVSGTVADAPPHTVISLALLRVAEEALHNVVRHANASRVRIVLSKKGERVEMKIEDNGVGFDPSRIEHFMGSREHWGLVTMRERIESIGGTFSVVSSSEGTTIVLDAPREIEP